MFKNVNYEGFHFFSFSIARAKSKGGFPFSAFIAWPSRGLIL
ncbi:Hypothetical protein Minf_0815 [Methylacidiphilum infernorum V4]|uniref:Uncharacterized protein n=1 Tax=Methylacidiphilum infernorum (isolate V4) TaxID=481448 RepID=B3E174_METI4|nr:Hypothetical protein Minf_0815 [Methylacidiphilum infernorum V4]